MRVDFYISEGTDPREVLELARAICQKAFEQRLPTYVWVNDVAQQQALDNWMWSKPATSFLPHGAAGDRSPIEIGVAEPSNPVGFLVNLSAQAPQKDGYERVAEIVAADQRELGRDKFRAHRKRLPEPPKTHTIKARFGHG